MEKRNLEERKGGKAASWKGVEKGDKLNSVKRFLKKNKSDEELPKLPKSEEPLIKQVENFITQQGIVDAVDGRRVNLANPDDCEGDPPSIRQRATHLITSSKNNNPRSRSFDSSRVPFVAAIPKTLSDADLVATGQHHGQNRIYYFKSYKQKTHLVVTDKNGDVLEQGNADGLLTQYTTDLRNQFDDSFRIAYKKSLLIPANTAALSNPAGVAPATDQTEGVPNRSTDNDNI
jgi:hypothetical protein